MTAPRAVRGLLSCALLLCMLPACKPDGPANGDDVLKLGPLSLVLEIPTRPELSPLSDADELLVTVTDRKADRTSTTTLSIADPDDRALDDVPWGDSIDVTVQARASAFDIITGSASARGIPVQGDEEVRLRFLRRLVYSNVDTWDAGDDGGAVWVSDLGTATSTGDRIDAPLLGVKADMQRPQDLYLTADARTLVVACVDFNEPDPQDPALGRVRIYDTLTNDLVDDARPDLETNEIPLPVPLAFARPLGDGYRLAGLSDDAPTLFVVDVRTGEVTSSALVAGNPGAWSVRGAAVTDDGTTLFVSAQVNSAPRLLRVELDRATPRVTEQTPQAGLTDADARGLTLSADGREVFWALSNFVGVFEDGDAWHDSVVEVRTGRDLALARTLLLPEHDFNIGALSRLPDGRLVGGLQGIDRTPDDCCRGTAMLDPAATAGTPTVLDFGVAAAVTTPEGDGVAVLDDFGNEQFQLVLFPRDGSAPIGIRPTDNAYYDSGSALAVPYGH